MGGFADYERYDAMGLAELVRQGQVTPLELCEAAIERIDSVNPAINAVVTRMDEEGRRVASRPLPDGPFAGVPMLVKDLHQACAGVRMTCGSRALATHVPNHDCELVRRFRNTGAVILGMTSTPEFGLLAVTEPELFGPCRNPWNTDYTPGGSSGGSAAAVAAGIAPIASAGDGGGSIRIPSAYCGLFGLKPSRGRNPTGPDHGLLWQGAVENHVITRTVRDSAAMLDATQGPDTGAPYVIRPPDMPYLEAVKRDPGVLRIAFNTRSPIGTSVDPECVKAVENTARLLDAIGHDLEEDRPAVDGPGLAKSYLVLYAAEMAADIEALKKLLGRKPGAGDLELATRTLGALGRSIASGDLVLALRQWDMAAREMGRFFETYDLYLTPTTAFPPAKIGELKPTGAETMLMHAVTVFKLGRLLEATGKIEALAYRSLRRTPFTQLANFCGLPAVSLPLHWTPDGLPLGVQFIGPFGGEDVLFQLSGQLEKARPWFDRRPEPVTA